MKNKIVSTFLLFFFTFLTAIYSQTSEREYMKWFDENIGSENTSIYNGFLDDGDGNFERNKSYRGTHRYFSSNDFLIGSLIYEDQPFYDIQIKYDVFEDELLLNLKSKRNTLLSVRPIKNKVKSFVIDGKGFVNCSLFPVKNDITVDGFAEVLLKTTSFILLKKHKKNRVEQKTNDRLLYEFVESSVTFLYFESSFYKVKKQKDFVRIFPEYKKEIREYKINKKTLEANMVSLLQRLQHIMSKKKKNNR